MCVGVGVYVCVYIYKYIYVCACVCVCVRVCARVCVWVRVCVNFLSIILCCYWLISIYGGTLCCVISAWVLIAAEKIFPRCLLFSAKLNTEISMVMVPIKSFLKLVFVELMFLVEILQQ
jgi:hypothetical protein